jgi:hypothetical protein
MKKIYLALMCMAGLTMMTACGGEKKADKAAENNGEATAEAAAEPAADPAEGAVFWDAPKGETEGAKAANWNVYEGTAKIAKAGGKDCIALLGEHAIVKPKVAGAERNFLGEKYTLEFDFLFGCDAVYDFKFFVNDHPDNDNVWEGAQDGGYVDEEVYDFSMLKPGSFNWCNKEKDIQNLLKADGWNHLKATYDKGSMKVFLNDTLVEESADIAKADYFVIYCQGQYYYEEEPDMSYEEGPYIANVRITN